MNPQTLIDQIPFVGPVYVKRLEKLGIFNLYDLLHHVPFRYDDFREIHKIANFPLNQIGSIKGEVLEFKNQYTKQGKRMQIVEVYDGTGNISAIWFNQPFLSKSLAPGTKAYFSGKMGFWNRKKAIYNPDFEIVQENSAPIHTARLVPIYHETYGVSSKWLRNKIYPLLQQINDLGFEEFLSDESMEQYKLVPFLESLISIHFPKSLEEAALARKRLAFNELLNIQLDAAKRRIAWQKNQVGKKLSVTNKIKQEFLDLLPFDLTSSQKQSIDEVLADLAKPSPMNRLLEGDVGSGKTVVAAAAAFVAYHNGSQSILMAPTQILAQQHFQTFSKLFGKSNIGVSLVTAQGIQKTTDKPSIFIGTHALLHTKEKLKNVSVIIVDEQHRFGVRQRAHLLKKTGKKSIAPHVLTMTATPIPRTIALTLYGDLDLSVLKELPHGRMPVKTWIVPPTKRAGAYEWMEKEIARGGQVFIVCPLIEESESETMKSVKSAKTEFENLKKIFQQRNLGLLHGKLKAKEKDAVIADFRAKDIDILVTTPVVEVGVDIPNATVMVIEAAERFGLASLHQLRGRVGRSDAQSYCLLFSENANDQVIKRLGALKEMKSGFELAEFDLEIRGPGELTGTKQHGFADLRIANWSDHDLIVQSRQLAGHIIETPQQYVSVLWWHKSKQIIEN